MLGTVNGDLIAAAWQGVLGLIFIYVALIVSDYVILPNYDDAGAIIKDGNTAVSIMVSGFVIATGIIAFSSFIGTGPWWTSILFFVIGQVILLGMSKVYEIMHPEMLEGIKKGNVTAPVHREDAHIQVVENYFQAAFLIVNAVNKIGNR